MSEQRVRLGIVGAGRNARRKHLPAFATMDNVDIVAVSNRTRASAQAVADAFDIPHVFTDWSSMLNAELTDAILVGTWPNLHGPVTVAALECGSHVLTEGRMAASLEDADAIDATARRHPDLVVQVVPTGLGLAVDTTVRRLVSEEIGPVVAVDGTFHEGGFLDPQAPPHWRELRASSGINIMSLGRRYEMLTRWISPTVRLQAVANTTVTERWDADGRSRRIDVPDVLGVLGTLASGSILNISMSRVTGHGPPTGFRLFGTEATLLFEASSATVWIGRRADPELVQVEIPAHERGSWDVEHRFIASIVEGAPVGYTTVSEGLRYMAFTDAVQRSLASGMVEAVRGGGTGVP